MGTRAALLGALLAAGCTSSVDVLGGSGEGGAGASGGAPGTGGDTSDDGGSSGVGGEGAGAPELVRRASVSVSQYELPSDPGPFLFSAVYAQFWRGVDVPSARCQTVEVGHCWAERCEGPESESGELVAAGHLVFSGAGGATIEADPNRENIYDADIDALVFSGGEPLQFDLSGAGDVPPFTATVVAPLPAALVTPDADAPMTLDRSQPFAVTWSGAAGGLFGFSVSQVELSAAERRAQVQCTFPGEDGSGVIPPEVLALLIPTAESGEPSSVFAFSLGLELHQISDWEVHVAAIRPAFTETGNVTYDAELTVE